MPSERYPHIILKDPPIVENYTSTSGGGGKNIPARDRQSHSDYLKNRLEKAWTEAEDEQAVLLGTRHGVYLEVKGEPGADLVTKSLDDMQSKKVRLLNVRNVSELEADPKTGQLEAKTTTYATVYIAHEKKGHFLKKLQQYADEETIKGNPKNADLVNSIADIRKALLVDSFWQDSSDLIPGDQSEWCEVLLSSDSQEIIERCERLLEQQEIEARNGAVRFPARAVKSVLANREQRAQ